MFLRFQICGPSGCSAQLHKIPFRGIKTGLEGIVERVFGLVPVTAGEYLDRPILAGILSDEFRAVLGRVIPAGDCAAVLGLGLAEIDQLLQSCRRIGRGAMEPPGCFYCLPRGTKR